ncbi:hypothetical protein B0A48_15558 [Cryoendolithus antarcticus]|uniref:Integral membrane protein n=1 Tax=Cryoendolithus antarcticus TaxID=1507870 RepID=A0A1V8SGJ5_9PEZI|nr:hypothetical protein B0A48_15558 [Cryoendolithus antarcticus]
MSSRRNSVTDYFSPSDRRQPEPTPAAGNGAHLRVPQANRPGLNTYGSRESMRSPSSIRIRRLPSRDAARPGSQASENVTTQDFANFSIPGSSNARRRSTSAPQRPLSPEVGTDLARQRTVEAYMPSIVEGQASAAQEARGLQPVKSRPTDLAPQLTPSISVARPDSREAYNIGPAAMHSAGNAARTNRGLRRFRSGALPPLIQHLPADDEYGADVIGMLDLIDPEVQTLGTLTNVQNSLFVPDLGRLLNRRPTYELSRRSTRYGVSELSGAIPPPRARAGTTSTQLAPIRTAPATAGSAMDSSEDEERKRRQSVSSQMSESRFAVLPHGVTLDGWSDEDIGELHDHVRHLLHSRREGFKRSMRGFRQYVKKPLGLFVTFYALSVTLFGLVWVLLLIGWISSGDDEHQKYVIDIVDNVLVAFFALMGDGLAPFRIVDTYHMCFIAKYHHYVWEKRKQRNLPALPDHNDLPDDRASVLALDMEDGRTNSDQKKDDLEEKREYKILTPLQQRRLQYHEAKFSKSHTLYKPHETGTHHAFPLRLLVAIVVLLDCHSIFQVALGTCTWSINYKVRSEALTTVILCFSLTCNIVAGILINVGDKRTRKKDVLDKIFRQNLTTEAIKHIQRRHDEAAQEEVGIAIADDAVLDNVKGLKLSRKSMEASRAAEQEGISTEADSTVPQGSEKTREGAGSRESEGEVYGERSPRPLSQF